MTGRSSIRRTCQYCLALFVYCLLIDHYLVAAEPEPLSPGMLYSDSLGDDTESLMLLKRLKNLMERKREVLEQETELAEEQIAIQAMLEAKSRDPRVPKVPSDFSDTDAEILPEPSAVVQHGPIHSRRTSYMALCHFKICNMGRKRQL